MSPRSLFADTPVAPVVTIRDAAMALPLADVLLESGIGAIEITLRTDAALTAIESIAAGRPQICVGAGSIRRPEQMAQVMDAGASFCVSPGFTTGLLEEAGRLGAGFIPGAATAAEMLALYAHGYEFLKFFPAELSGGVRMLQAVSAPLPELRFFPTGGISQALAPTYLALEQVVCVGASWFVPADRIQAGDFAWIREQAAAAMEAVRG